MGTSSGEDSVKASYMEEGLLIKRWSLSFDKIHPLLVTSLWSTRIMLVTIVLEMEILVRRFLWGTSYGGKKNLVSYEMICLPIDYGGLGLKRICEFNMALMSKWLWRCREDTLWIRLIKEKYGVKKGMSLPNFTNKPTRCSIWRGLKKVAKLFRLLTCKRVGENSGLTFWDELWVWQKPLLDLFSNFFLKLFVKNVGIGDFLADFNNST